jgi:putative peptidoglycan lipid II flippase
MNDTPHSPAANVNPQGSERSRVVRAAGVVGGSTFLSRIFGFIRDMVIAGFFGAGVATDAFFVAFRIPNLLRSLLAEGSLTIAFVPVFTEYLKTRSRNEALKLASVSFTLLSMVLAVITLAGILFAPWIVRLIAWGFSSDPGRFGLTVYLTRLMFPYIFFISLVALCMGILNSLRHFAAPALSPVVLNISIIASALLLRGFFHEPVVALALGVLAGGLLQLGMQFPVMARLGVRLRPNFDFTHPGLRKIGILMLPAVFGAAVYQVNIFVGTLLASFLEPGSVSYLYYADRVVQLPLGIFAFAVGTAILPSFSEQVAVKDYDELKKTLSFALRILLFVTIPCMIALFVLRVPIISVLFQRGEFDLSSTEKTAYALFLYALGLWAFSGMRVMVSAFYSLKDTAAPVKIAFVAFLVNVTASLSLMGPLRHGGLALAVSIASSVNFLALCFVLRRKIGPFLEADFVVSVARCFLSSLIMGAAIAGVLILAGWDTAAPAAERILVLSGAIITGGVVFTLSAYLLKSPEVIFLRDRLRRRAPNR